MPELTQERLIAKEVALGTIRELEPPLGHIGTRLLAPFQEVGADDVIFDYARGLTDGLAPARAEDAESELAQKDLLYGGTGRASVIDWSLKDHYSASDVQTYTETRLLAARLGLNTIADLPTNFRSPAEEMNAKMARDDVLRRRKLDNRIEWLCTQPLQNNAIVYNDGKVKFTVTYGRPSNQTSQAPAGGTWNLTTSDPIGDILAVQEYMYDLYSVHMTRVIGSKKILNSILNSDRFAARSGMAGGTGALPIDPNYLIDGWGPGAAQAVVERATNITFIPYDSVYRTRAIGSTTIVNNRFIDDTILYFLPSEQDVSELDDMIGFGKTLTSPHAEGNFTPGYYEWEIARRDPWGVDRGTGIKAFPIYPHLEWTYTMKVLP